MGRVRAPILKCLRDINKVFETVEYDTGYSGVVYLTVLNMSRIVCLLFLGVLVGAQEDEGGKCERIRLPLCQDLGYNWTAMPNLMGHRDQKEAEEAVGLIVNLTRL